MSKYQQTGSKVLDSFNKAYKYIILMMFGLIPCLVGIRILTRWILAPQFDIRLQWAGPLAQMFLIYVTFLGAGLASRDREHVSIDTLFTYVPVNIARLLQFLQLLLTAWFLYVFISGNFGLIKISGSIPFQSLPPVAPLTTAWIYRIVVVGAFLMLVYTLRDIWIVGRYKHGVNALIGEDNEDE